MVVAVVNFAIRPVSSVQEFLDHCETLLDKIGKKKEALALVEQILRITPNDPIVQGHYKRLGGNPVAFVRNLPPAPVAAASAASAAETTAAPAAVPGAAASAPAAAATAPALAPALPGSAAKP